MHQCEPLNTKFAVHPSPVTSQECPGSLSYIRVCCAWSAPAHFFDFPIPIPSLQKPYHLQELVITLQRSRIPSQTHIHRWTIHSNPHVIYVLHMLHHELFNWCILSNVPVMVLFINNGEEAIKYFVPKRVVSFFFQNLLTRNVQDTNRHSVLFRISVSPISHTIRFPNWSRRDSGSANLPKMELPPWKISVVLSIPDTIGTAESTCCSGISHSFYNLLLVPTEAQQLQSQTDKQSSSKIKRLPSAKTNSNNAS